MIIHHLILVASFVAAIQGGRNCGANPSMIYLKRGDKSSVEYWIPAESQVQPEPEEELSLQSRFDERGEEEEEEEEEHDDIERQQSAPLADLSTTVGLTTWRTNDEEFAIESKMTTTSIPAVKHLTVSTERMAISDSIQIAEHEEETSTGLTGLKVTDDVTISPHAPPLPPAEDAVPADASDALSRVNDHVQAETTEHQQQAIDVTELAVADVTEQQTTESTINLANNGQQSQSDESLVEEHVPISTTASALQEFNMEPITSGVQPTDIEVQTKAELLEHIMQQEELRPHTSPPPASSVKKQESISVDNASLLDRATVLAVPQSVPPPATEQPTEMATESVQLEIAKTATDESAFSDDVSQLKADFQDIAHLLMSVPDLPPSENQVKAVETTETNEPETVTLADFKSDLEFAVDTHAEEIETTTLIAIWPAKTVKVQTGESASALPIQQDEPSAHLLANELQVEDATEMSRVQLKQSEGSAPETAETPDRFKADEPESNDEQGSGLADSIQDMSAAIPAIQNEDGTEGSGGSHFVRQTQPVAVEFPAMDEPEIEDEQSGPVGILGVVEMGDPILVKVESAAEGSGSDATSEVDGSDEPETAIDVVQEESPPEFRNDDILINRIRTIVNSLTNPKDTSSSFLRRTSGLLQSVFKRTKRSTTNPADLVNSPAFRQFLRSQPLPLRRALSPNFSGRFSRQMASSEPEIRDDAQSPEEECDLHIKTDPGLHLLLTFHNMSAPYTLDCAGAYVEIEREGNGFEARWCGKPIGQRGVRSHVIFARSEVRVSVYNNRRTLLQHQIAVGGEGINSLESQPSPVNDQLAPTGFSADIEVIDLHDAGQFTSFQRSQAYSNVHRRIG
ncbi:uncharacterized protein LOC130696548 isoform X2 [Daphnia carinata]|uniref:uncharacterized protein LOC130696548 isoform X2 n=1 Tax=Daphnia carinata TaxID=120202 RepID=UPI00257B6C1D|nr:uncharacterized protein LOC130696548 isoform X2 [Daphnia carinata]